MRLPSQILEFRKTMLPLVARGTIQSFTQWSLFTCWYSSSLRGGSPEPLIVSFTFRGMSFWMSSQLYSWVVSHGSPWSPGHQNFDTTLERRLLGMFHKADDCTILLGAFNDDMTLVLPYPMLSFRHHFKVLLSFLSLHHAAEFYQQLSCGVLICVISNLAMTFRCHTCTIWRVAMFIELFSNS